MEVEAEEVYKTDKEGKGDEADIPISILITTVR